jgi:putative phage-type endonuclease
MGRMEGGAMIDRTKTLGASEIAAVLGRDEYRTAVDVWESKVLGKEQPDNEHMARGRILEPALLDWWEYLEGVRLVRTPRDDGKDQRQRLVTHSNGWATATLDGFSEDGRIVEVKCPVGGKGWDDRKGLFPFRYALQVQWQFGVSKSAGLSPVSGVLAAGPIWGKLMRFQIEFDAELFALMLAKGDEFMTYVRRKEPLPPSFTSLEADKGKQT